MGESLASRRYPGVLTTVLRLSNYMFVSSTELLKGGLTFLQFVIQEELTLDDKIRAFQTSINSSAVDR
jgi:hypothetical protein